MTAIFIIVALGLLVVVRDLWRIRKCAAGARLSRDDRGVLAAHLALAILMPLAFALLGHLGVIPSDGVLPASLVAMWIALTESVVHLLRLIPRQDP